MAECCLSSFIFSLFVASLYVGSLYCWPNSKHRDDPLTIKRRFISVICTSIISILLLMKVLPKETSFNSQLGLSLPNLTTAWKCVGEPLTFSVILFLGPCTLSMVQAFKNCDLLLNNFNLNLIIIRNYLVAPFTEELIFRGVLTAILAGCWSKWSVVFISSLLFGVAHSHHYLFQNCLQGEMRKINKLATVEQMTYTTLFGSYASILYLNTKFMLTPVLVHAFCNLMGLPDFSSLFSSKFLLAVTVTGFFIWFYYIVYISLNLPDL